MIKIYKIEEYDYTHEREQFRNLCELLKKEYENRNEVYLLFGNISFSGVSVDALFIKPDAIIALEFKNYAGKVLAAENGDWKLKDGSIIKGGLNKNPYQQVHQNKWNIINTFNVWFPKPTANAYHTSGVVVFNQEVEVDDSLISRKVKTWFHITDMKSVTNKLADITSRGIRYSNEDLIQLPKILNCEDKLIYPLVPNDNVEQPAITPDSQPADAESLHERVKKVLEDGEFEIVNTQIQPGKEAVYHQGEMNFGNLACEYVQGKYPHGLYKHQYEAAHLAQEGKNVCLATSTSSGKTTVFHLAALNILSNDSDAKILAIYPMRALGSQQDDSWAGINNHISSRRIKCGRIDGENTDVGMRLSTLRDSQIVSMTPDVVHTFLLGKLKDERCRGAIIEFFSKLKLVIVDELHLYRGLLGTNSAYLFRRLNSAVYFNSDGREPQYITASATIKDPIQHSTDITGSRNTFELIGNDKDTSPSCNKYIYMVKNRSIATLLEGLCEQIPDNRSITFVDSRTRTERSVAELTQTQEGVFSFRAGFERTDYRKIMDALRDGNFKAVVSTAALEVGIDIGNLDIAIIYGMPYSSTSFNQRIGRVGRGNAKEAVIIIVEDPKNIQCLKVFKDPGLISRGLPPEEPALYMDNDKIANINALHFVGAGQEYQSATGEDTGRRFDEIKSYFPLKFTNICGSIFNNQTTRLYNDIANDAGDDSQLYYTLRSNSGSFSTECRMKGGAIEGRGELTLDNVFKEAYPGAIYYYLGSPYRVTGVNRRDRVVSLRVHQGRWCSTKPYRHLTVTPQGATELFKHVKLGGLELFNMELNEYTCISGYTENGGNIRFYPNEYYSQRRFDKTIRTTGVVFIYPGLENVQKDKISILLNECLLSEFSFDRSEVEHRWGKLNITLDNHAHGTHFFTIYDKVEGGLNITSILLDKDVLERNFKKMVEIIDDNKEEDFLGYPMTDETKGMIHEMYKEIKENNPIEDLVNAGNRYCIARKSQAYYQREDETTGMEVWVDLVLFRDNFFFYDIVDDADNIIAEDVLESELHPIPGISGKAIFEDGKAINIHELW